MFEHCKDFKISHNQASFPSIYLVSWQFKALHLAVSQGNNYFLLFLRAYHGKWGLFICYCCSIGVLLVCIIYGYFLTNALFVGSYQNKIPTIIIHKIMTHQTPWIIKPPAGITFDFMTFIIELFDWCESFRIPCLVAIVRGRLADLAINFRPGGNNPNPYCLVLRARGSGAHHAFNSNPKQNTT